MRWSSPPGQVEPVPLGAPPLASPRLSRRRHGLNLRCRCPLGGLPGRSPADLAVPESVGVACFLCCLPTLPLVYFFAPLPRRGRIDPQPPSPPGKGENQGYFMQGAPPLAFPRVEPMVRRKTERKRFPTSSAGSQGEGGPGEMELSVASDGGV